MRSRLRSNVKKQSIHLVLFMIAIVIILAVFGTNLLVGFSVALDRLRGADEVNQQQQGISYLAPPVLDPLPNATKENNINISGLSTETDEILIELHINGKSIEKSKPSEDGAFSFENIQLQTGENEIKAKSIAAGGEKESEFSDSVKVKYLNKEPGLEISVPTDGQTFKKDQGQIRLSGKTDPGAKVTVNDFWTITKDDGDFYYTYTLKDGENPLKFVSTDEAGNTTTKEIKIKAE